MDSLPKMDIRLEQVHPLMQEFLQEGKTVKFSPRGVSMLPMLRQGIDSVVLSPITGKLHKYDLPLYQRDNGKYVLHRIVEAGETYTCIGDNQFQLETGLRHDQMIAVVSAFTRGGKTYPVTDPRYRLYCRVWCASRPVRHFWHRGINWLKRHIRK